jgi:hypothetical protein
MNVFQVHLPVRGNDGTDNVREGIIDAICVTIAQVAGGLTATEGTGMWLDDAGKLVRDKVINVQTYCDDAALATLQGCVNAWRRLLDQDALVTAVWSAQVQFVS